MPPPYKKQPNKQNFVRQDLNYSIFYKFIPETPANFRSLISDSQKLRRVVNKPP